MRLVKPIAKGRLTSPQMAIHVSPQQYTPAAQRRALLRATPATLTGVQRTPHNGLGGRDVAAHPRN